MKKTLLIIDDEAIIRKALQKYFEGIGYEVLLAGTGEEGMHTLDDRIPDLVLVDLKLPGMSGVDFLRQARSRYADLLVIMITGNGTIPSAVEAIREGAFYYVTKPFDLEDLGLLVEKAIDHQKLQRENIALKQELKSKYQYEKMVGTSKKIQDVLKLIDQVAKTDSTVLILGESGTGKELVAKAIHYNSARAQNPLITVNCGAIPENLLESELFGHMKGAFTGAVSTRPGRFEAAHGGTIFLDEIGDMSPSLQVKILRVLQDHQFQPVGSTKTREVDVRVLAATNQNLEQAVAAGTFREDLFYRLNVIPVTLCGLKERREDIPLLLEHFLKRANKAGHKEVAGFSPEVLKTLTQYAWPGNVRELENLVERLVILKGAGTIEKEDLPENFLGKPSAMGFYNLAIPDTGVSFRDLSSEFERQLILQALQKSGGNKNKAATLLQLNRTTLIEKIRKCHLERETVNHVDVAPSRTATRRG